MMGTKERHFAPQISLSLEELVPQDHCPAIWENSPLGKLQALPIGARPIIKWSNKELAFMDVAEGIQKAIDKLKDN